MPAESRLRRDNRGINPSAEERQCGGSSSNAKLEHLHRPEIGREPRLAHVERGQAHAPNRMSRLRLGGCLSILCIAQVVQQADGWIALSDKGYQVKHSLVAQAGVKVQGEVGVNGFIISKPVAQLQCNPSRRGAIRWNDEQFEGCNGETDWQPLSFCSRSCTINTNSVPCGLSVRNRCDKSCNQYGSGLNMRQCILNVASTPCQQPVRDLCGNACGLEGQMRCESLHKDVGKMILKALAPGESATSNTTSESSFELGVRNMTRGSFHNGLFWTFKNSTESDGEDMVVFQKLEQTSPVPDLVPPRGPTDHQPVKEKPFGTTRGMEISKPPSNEEATLRVSMYTELTGGYIRVGEDYNSPQKEEISFIFLDSTIEKECPFLMNAANYEDDKFTKVCLEPARDQEQEIVLPDASGIAIAAGNQADVRSLPGLRAVEGESSLMYRGMNKDKEHIIAPDAPRVDCSQFSCSAPGINMSSCQDLDYDDAHFDMYRLFYGIVPDMSDIDWSPEVTQIIREFFDEDGILRTGATFADVARTFVSLLMTEAGVDLQGMDVEEALLLNYGLGPVTWKERCFKCCCHAYVAVRLNEAPGVNASNVTNAERGVCPHDLSERPTYCTGGPRVGLQCIDESDCAGVLIDGSTQASTCGYDPEIVTCLLSDHGWMCWNVVERGMLTTRVDFVSPQSYRFLEMPAVSGTVISTGNLEDVTSLGVQTSPLVVLSSQSSTTSIRFEREKPGWLQQANRAATNNTLVVPNNIAEAVLITSGNLEDITLNSGAMTGLRVEHDVHIQRLLKFGDNSSRSGFLLNPVVASEQYTTPHSSRPASYARPGQLSFQVHDSLTVLEFEPAKDGSRLSTISIPASSGSVVTTGNLEAITAQSGAMSSVAVTWLSHLQGGVVVGSLLETQLTLQGHAGHAMTFETRHLKASSRAHNQMTEVKFDLASANASEIIFPAVSGTIISSGNMPDIHEYTGSSTRVHREAHFRGPTFVGPLDSLTNFVEPLHLSGYVTGEIVHREAKKLEELNRGREQVTAPFTWDLERFNSCNLDTLAGLSPSRGRVSEPYFSYPYMSADPWSVKVLWAPLEACKLQCEAKPGCGVLLASRYWKVKMLSLVDYRPSQPEDSLTNYVSNAIRKPIALNGFLAADECYPGFNPIFEPESAVQDVIPVSSRFDAVMNLTKYPDIRSYWTSDSSCQGVIAARQEEWQPQFGNAWTGFAELDLQAVRCGSQICSDPDTCGTASQECVVLIKSRVNGFYLGGHANSECLDQVVKRRPCARWTPQATIWTSVPFKLQASHSRYADWQALNTDTFFRFRREGACADIDAARHLASDKDEHTFDISCPGDEVQSINISWGDVGGVCGGYFSEAAACTDLDVLMESMLAKNCLGDGCTLRLQHIYGLIKLQVTTASGSYTGEQNFKSCVGKRFALEFRCKQKLYLGRAKAGVKPHFEMWSQGGDDNTLFHVHSSDAPDVGAASMEEDSQATEAQVKQSSGLWRECWLSKAPAHDCQLQPDGLLDVHMFMRHDSISLAFASPSQQRKQYFPDASGSVISSGNLKDISNLRGLYWKDAFMYKHLPKPELREGAYQRAPVTYIDFAAIGSGNDQRSDGEIPPEFTTPEGGNRRIVFPDSSGTVITTGNIDDLLFKRLNLQGLRLDGRLSFKNMLGPLVNARFEDSSRIAGCLNMVSERGTAAFDKYTQICTAEPTKANAINLPDVSGRILSTGNLLNLPTMRFAGSELFVGKDSALEGDMQVGLADLSVQSPSQTKAFAWLDGDVGMTFASANNSISIRGDVLSVHSPHMGGVDTALRHFLTEDVGALQVSVRDSKLLGTAGERIAEYPIDNTSKINQSMCFDLLTRHHVHGMHGLGYFVHRRHLIQQTILTGIPYWGVEVPGNQTFPACVDTSSQDIVCEVKFVEDSSSVKCPCKGLKERMMVRWRRTGKQIIKGYRSRCSGNESSVVDGEMVLHPTSNCAYSEADCHPGALNDSGCAFDGDVATQYASNSSSVFVTTPWVEVQPAVMRLEAVGSNQFPQGMAEIGRCVLGLRLLQPVGVSMVRVYPAEDTRMVGGVLQASSDVLGEVWVDIFEFRHEPARREWTDVLVPEYRDASFTFLRYLGPGCAEAEECSCDVAEWEWHQGSSVQRLTARDRGIRSYYVDRAAVQKDAEGAMVLKCVGQGWVPSKLQSDVQEIMLPEASGTVVTTGNLEDITKLSGMMTSVKVAGDMDVGGSTILGVRGDDAQSRWNSLLTGRFPLAMGGAGNHDAASFLCMPDPSMDQMLYWPAGSSGGRILTTGALPPLRTHLSVVGDAAVHGPLSMSADVVIGDLADSAILKVHSSISTPFPLSFKETSTPDDQRLVLGVEEPTADRVLMLPDVTGTVITTGNLPDIMQSMTLIGDTVFEGGVKFVKDDVSFGAPGSTINLAIHLPIGGTVPLKFEGKQVDDRTLSLSVEEPSGHNVVSLPDVTGTVITTGNFPDTVENLQVLGKVDMYGEVRMLGRKISIGHDELKTKLAVNSIVSGRFPLTFGHVSDSNRANETLAATTTFEIIPPSSDNVISFPDTSGRMTASATRAALDRLAAPAGSVITTGNIPTTVMVPNEYTLEVKAFRAMAWSTAIGQGAKAGSPAGSFLFAAGHGDADAHKAGPEVPENSFNVRAPGGVKFITGYTASNREIGVLLDSMSSAWSVLSDEESKIKLGQVDDGDTLDKLCGIPVSTWRYQGQGVTHMGAMAQDMHAVLGVGEASDRISTIDADGAMLSALRGLWQRQAGSDGAEAGLRALDRQLSRQEGALERQRHGMVLASRRLELVSQQLEALERSAHARSVER